MGQQKTKVLLIDDERIVADNLAVILRQRGFECSVAYTGTAGIEAARLVPPDWVVMDMSLPGLPSTVIAKSLFDEQPRCKLVLYSGAAEAGEYYFEPLRRMGYEFETLASPFKPQRLLELLSQKIERQGC